MPDRTFTFEIEEHFGIISSREGWNKELNLVRWNGAAAKYDIREWDEHHEQMHRGLTLTPWEMRNMVDLFVSRNNDAAVARGRAIEAGRNARRLAARQKAEAEAAAALIEEPISQEGLQTQESEIKTPEPAAGVPEETGEEQQALEGAVPPYVESGSEAQEEMTEGEF